MFHVASVDAAREHLMRSRPLGMRGRSPLVGDRPRTHWHTHELARGALMSRVFVTQVAAGQAR